MRMHLPLRSFPISLLFMALVIAGCHKSTQSPKDAPLRINGTISSFNYTPRGDVDGFVLTSGEVIRVGPKQARDMVLSKGTRVSILGDPHIARNGERIIEAREVTRDSSGRY